MRKQFKIGEVYYIDFSGNGSEQSGVRPGVVLQNNIGNKHSPNIIALPMTSVKKKVGQPTHVVLDKTGSGLPKDSVVLCENPVCVSKTRIKSYITTLPHKYMCMIAEASVIATPVISYVSKEKMFEIWGKAIQINSM